MPFGNLTGQKAGVQSVDNKRADNNGNVQLDALSTKGGQMTGELKMGGNKISGLADAKLGAEAANVNTVLTLITQGYNAAWKSATLTLTADGWQDGSQFVSLEGITASNLVIATPAVGPQIASNANMEAYESSGVYLYAQEEGRLQFGHYLDKPTTDVYVNVIFRPEVIFE